MAHFELIGTLQHHDSWPMTLLNWMNLHLNVNVKSQGLVLFEMVGKYQYRAKKSGSITLPSNRLK